MVSTLAAAAASPVRLQRFDPPGNADKLTEAQRVAWSRKISDIFDECVKGDPEEYINDGPRAQFYNPLHRDIADDRTTKVISWNGFPRKVKLTYPIDKRRWEVADSSRHVQDEYCEWSVARDMAGKITQVTFTCEGPEYWKFLGKTDPQQVLRLYQQYINNNVQMSDLFQSGVYNPYNKWNNSTTNGAIHLIQRNNTLSAEIELAAGSSVVRKINGHLLSGQQELIECGRYGDPDRNSDPLIGAEVNRLTRESAAMVTLENPVGLYFGTFETEGWRTPDGSPADSYWTVLRGDSEHSVRAVYEVPASKGFTVSDIKIGRDNILFGAQIADFVKIKLIGVAQELGRSQVPPLTGCRKERPVLTAAAAHSTALSSLFALSPTETVPMESAVGIGTSTPVSASRKKREFRFDKQ